MIPTTLFLPNPFTSTQCSSFTSNRQLMKECARPENRIGKMPDIRLDMLPTAITAPTNIYG